MKNITLAIDEKVLKAARIYAAEHDTSVSALVRDYLVRLATGEASADAAARRAEARKRLLELSETSRGSLGEWKWNRDDIYSERLSRYQHTGLRRHAERRRGGKDKESP